MRKNAPKFLFALFVLFALSAAFCGTAVYANSMSLLDYHIELQEDGSGVITETRHMYLTEDTEIYIVMENLGGSEVTNFHVSDFGEPLSFEPNWDIDASREEKAGKYGIVETNNGQELSWGIGEYGEHEYTVSYTISGMVRQLEDGQGMNWRFFDGRNNINPEEVTITITGSHPFTQEYTKIWGFGFAGEIHLENGDLVGWSNTELSDRNHITILMQFLDNPFQPTLSLERTLSEQEEDAKDGSSYNDPHNDPSDTVLFVVIGIFIFIIVLFTSIYTSLRHRAIQRENPLVTGKKRRLMNEGKYYREVPYKYASITDVAYLLQRVGKGEVEDYFSAFMLKWLKEQRITYTTKSTGRKLNKKSSTIQVNRGELNYDAPSLEKKFWNVITSAADSDGKLYEKKLKNWTEINYKKITDIKLELDSQSKERLFDQDYLIEKRVDIMNIFPTTIIKSTPKGEELFNNLIQFENYLDDFSLLNEREVKEVVMWEDLLIWASLYGLADQVSKQLEKFHPQYINNTQITYTDIYLMRMYTRSFTKGYESGYSAASGGGGSTSIGGGGGSFGGGGGGSR
ncbi:putative membrane protein YgcG [Natronobacillus azotifigens]|uniref:DUF2207 domain-containing protein n=1 Tax=Natronobacillus azotifigens TaxID=472978 RepID=A0A9J6RF95_9BACI|nr:DUF2207 domain-containing protein [Natronobacillus azotifigens]MCZ0704426.1 DUF2207 domain-containing protein [Natronobacillus azotifigens]